MKVCNKPLSIFMGPDYTNSCMTSELKIKQRYNLMFLTELDEDGCY